MKRKDRQRNEKQLVKVAHVITGLDTGGAQRSLFELVRSLDQSRLNCIVISFRHPDFMSEIFAQAGIKVHHLGMQIAPFSLSLGMARLLGILRGYRPHILQGWMYHANLVCTLARSLLPRRPRVIWGIRHSLHDLKREKLTTRWLIGACARLSRNPDIIVYNAYSSAAQHRAVGYDSAREVLILNGVDLERFKPSLEARRWLRKELLGISDDVFLVGMVARFHLTKGYDLCLEAMGRVAKQREGVRLLLVGRGMEESNAALRSLIRANGLGSKALLLGERPDTERILPGLDLLCSPSRGESFPNVVIEAMACGVPCAVTDVGDSAKIVGDCGCVVHPGDSEALVKALQAFIMMSSEDRKALSVRARKQVECFDHKYTVERYSSLYEALLSM
ncbi:MAG: glycosyltransferase [Thermodesulfobacteriota bacterium]